MRKKKWFASTTLVNKTNAHKERRERKPARITAHQLVQKNATQYPHNPMDDTTTETAANSTTRKTNAKQAPQKRHSQNTDDAQVWSTRAKLGATS